MTSEIKLGIVSQARIILENDAGTFCRDGDWPVITVIVRGPDGFNTVVTEHIHPDKATELAEVFRVWAGG